MKITAMSKLKLYLLVGFQSLISKSLSKSGRHKVMVEVSLNFHYIYIHVIDLTVIKTKNNLSVVIKKQ